jgi:serine/threonine-protein kinase
MIRKYNRLVFLMIAIFLAACGQSTPAPTPTPPTDGIRVEADGSGDYATLEEAIAAVVPGGTITLGAGTYRLVYGMKIEKSFTLVGAGMDESEIVSGFDGHVIRVESEGILAAQDLTFRHDGEQVADVVVVQDGRVDFSRCRFTGAVYAEGEGNRAGIRFLGSAGGAVRESEIVDNDNTGIMVDERAAPVLEDNLLLDNSMVGIGYMGQASGTARGNECSGSSVGVAVTVEARPTLEQNVFSANEYGMAYWDSAGGKASQNECTGNRVGIGVSASAGPELVDNNCYDNSEEDVQDMRE